MSVRELSWEERNKLMQISAVPVLITFFGFLGYLIYLMENRLLPTIWDVLVRWGLPCMLGAVAAGMVTFEVGYHWRVKSPWRFHVKRLGGQSLLLVACAFSFVGLVGLMDEVLSPSLGGKGFLVGSFMWTLLLAAVGLKFRRIVAKLANGEW